MQSTKAFRRLLNSSFGPFFWILITLGAIAVVTLFAPAEKTLGVNARVVYLHGVWVWTALAAFVAAATLGLVGLIFRRENWQYWSRACGRAGLVFWITYLPISLWAMQTNWNGLFLAEPRWRLAVIFAIGGLILQVGLTLMEDPVWAAASNVVFLLVMLLALGATENVMHPPAPILNSHAPHLQLFFGGLLLLTLLAAGQVARWFHKVEQTSIS